MVEYTEWIEAVHEAFQRQGGTYNEDTAAELVEIAGEFWQENKEELIELAFDAAIRVAMRQLNV